MLRALTAPLGAVSAIEPSGSYAGAALSTGLLEGYNTMDALASLAFGIIVVNAIRGLGVEEPGQVPQHGAGGSIQLAAHGAHLPAGHGGGRPEPRGLPAAANGGEALAQIAEHYFGAAGALILAATVTIACLKRRWGSSPAAAKPSWNSSPKSPGLPVWAVIFCAVSFLIAYLASMPSSTTPPRC